MKNKKLGKLILSATGLRKMANYLQKQYKTKGDVLIDCEKVYIDRGYTFGYESKSGEVVKNK